MSKKVIAIAVAVLVFAAFVPGLNAQNRDTVHYEYFNGSWSTTSPPAGWEIVYNPPANNSDWHRYTGTQQGHAGPMARLYWSPSGSGQTDRLISPVMDCSNPSYESVFLSVWHYMNNYPGTYINQIRGSDNGGSTYPHIILDYGDEDGGGFQEIFDITSWALGQNDVRIDFYGYGNTFNIDWWCVDSFIVYGEWSGGGPGGDLDLEIVQIIRPKDLEEGGVAFTPTCKIYNNLDTTAHALMRCRIKDSETQQTVYQDVLSMFPCEPGYTTCDAFNDFTPEANTRYNVLFAVEHPDDVNQTNNSKDKNFTTAVGMQVDAIEILVPADDQFDAFSPQANFKEMLGEKSVGAERVWMWCKIEDLAYHAVLYLDSIGPEDFDPDEVKNPLFLEVGNETLTTGSYIITFWATDTDKKSIGEEIFKEFDYTEAIAEAPIAELYGLDVVGHTVNFSVGKATDVTLRVYDAAGNLVATLASGTHNAGSHSVKWDADVAPGVYFVKMITPEFSASGKMVVLY